MPQIKLGTIVSTKMDKTVVVEVRLRKIHPLYKKVLKRSVRIKAHDELDTKIGQKVKIEETKPFSKQVHFKIVEVVK